MFRFFIKEASLLTAFIVLGGILLLCVWLLDGIQKSVLNEFQNTQVSVILKEGSLDKFKDLLEKDKNVVRYKIFSGAQNQARLGQYYPELKNVISPLDDRFFPTSAVVTLSDSKAFLSSLWASPDLFEAQLLHQPPEQLSRFLKALTFVFTGLWLLTLTLVLYFNLERLLVREEPRWSLMKMLGAKPVKLFMPLWYGQAIRISIACLSAVALSTLATHQVKSFFNWHWAGIPLKASLGFFLASLILTSLISFGLFYSKYRRVSLG